MALNRQPQDYTADEAIDLGIRLMYEGEPPRQAALHVLEHGIDQDAYEAFAARGLAAILSDEIAQSRQPVSEDAAETPSGSGVQPGRSRSGRLAAYRPHGAQQRAAWLVRLNDSLYEGADGIMRRLIDFTRADWQRLTASSRARAAGYNALATAGEKALLALSRHKKASCLAECPAADQRIVGEALP